ncbi:hypothetical protein [Shewanella chilikensis]|uniref:hypothetical protein n=1 Tax=Shewanella chilikensis TaxID=558541 RepID=UPI003B67620B
MKELKNVGKNSMDTVYQLKANTADDGSGVVFGGGTHIAFPWPVNPLGEELALVVTIDCSVLNHKIGEELFPAGKVLSVFSTYSSDRYFLDDITFHGDSEELEHISKGYSRVLLSEKSDDFINENYFGPISVEVTKREVNSEDFPAFSFVSKVIPRGLIGYGTLDDEYYFVAQIYSGDIPFDEGGILGLSDATGYLFLRKRIDGFSNAGVFFIQVS